MRTLWYGVVTSSVVLLASCGGGSSSGTAAVSGANHAPQISGSPTATVQSGTAYSFSPSVSDADGNQLTFQITNQPSWASFDANSGALTGTPTDTQVGSYGNIVISVDDGTTSTSLTPFTITVTQIVTGNATISWLAPTQNSDGTALTNLAGYRIYYGTNPTAPSQAREIQGVGSTTYVLQDLAPGTWYFTVRAYTTADTESAPSNIASKVIQ